ncbi:MAG TPA: precorrin-2 C(20)-methyltransferase [Syntrophorhabdaceae bacterium]|jgi:precorrin-2/cobalt-factor-2 C20-methyltransferase
MKAGKLYVIGVGPGDPELLTLKGARTLGRISCIVVPKGREEGSSLALSIARKAVDLSGKEVVEVHFPMVKASRDESHGACDLEWNGAVETIAGRLNEGRDIAFLTIGDPAIYSTFFNIYDRLIRSDPRLEIEIIPGVSSINASAARACLSLGLGDGKIALIPAPYEEHLREILEKFDTVVLMKVYKVMEKVRRALDETGLTGKAVYVSRVGMEGEKVIEDITSLTEADMDYFSLVIVRK